MFQEHAYTIVDHLTCHTNLESPRLLFQHFNAPEVRRATIRKEGGPLRILHKVNAAIEVNQGESLKFEGRETHKNENGVEAEPRLCKPHCRFKFPCTRLKEKQSYTEQKR